MGKNFLILLFAVLLSACSMGNDEQNNFQEDTSYSEKEELALKEKLISSAAAGDTEKVLQLLEEGADIDATDEQGRTAVLAATYNDHSETVEALIQKGADVDIRDHNLENVLLNAGARGNLEIVRLAIEAGADPTITNRYGGVAIIPASERGHVEVVRELLVNSDTDVNHINNLYWTALLEAVILGDGGKKHQEIVQLLVDHGADLSIADKEGITPLAHAQDRGFREIEAILKRAES